MGEGSGVGRGEGAEERLEEWGGDGRREKTEGEGTTTEGCDEGVAYDVDGDSWGGVEEDVRKGFVDDDDSGSGVKEEGDRSARVLGEAEAEEGW